jgi:hypothetical protein
MAIEALTEEQAQAEWDKMDDEDVGTGSLAEVLQTDAPQGLEVAAAPADEPVDDPAGEPAPAAKPAETAPEDPLKTINDAIANLARTVQAAQSESRQMQGKIGGLADALKQVKAEAAVAKVAAAPGGPSASAIEAAQKSPAEWEALKSDFPEWGNGVEKFVESKLQAVAKTAAPAIDIDGLIAEKIAPVIDQRIDARLRQVREAEVQEKRVFETISQAHPGWTETVKTPEFKAWQAAQAPGIQALGDSDRVEDAIEMLNLYTRARPSKTAAQVQAERDARLARSVGPTKTVNPGPRTAVAVDDLSPDEFWAYLDRQEAAANRAAR